MPLQQMCADVRQLLCISCVLKVLLCADPLFQRLRQNYEERHDVIRTETHTQIFPLFIHSEKKERNTNKNDFAHASFIVPTMRE